MAMGTMAAITETATTDARSQRAARVSTLLRHSTRSERVNGMPGPRAEVEATVGVAVIIGRSPRGSVSVAVGPVRAKKSCSRPARSAARSSTRSTPACAATDATCSAVTPLVVSMVTVPSPSPVQGIPAPVSAAMQCGLVGGAGHQPGRRQQVGQASVGDDLAGADHDQPVDGGFDLGQQVAGQQHGAALVGEVAEQFAHPGDAFGVETVGRFVQDEHLGMADQGLGDAEALTHPERVGADPLVGGRRGEPDRW